MIIGYTAGGGLGEVRVGGHVQIEACRILLSPGLVRAAINGERRGSVTALASSALGIRTARQYIAASVPTSCNGSASQPGPIFPEDVVFEARGNAEAPDPRGFRG